MLDVQFIVNYSENTANSSSCSMLHSNLSLLGLFTVTEQNLLPVFFFLLIAAAHPFNQCADKAILAWLVVMHSGSPGVFSVWKEAKSRGKQTNIYKLVQSDQSKWTTGLKRQYRGRGIFWFVCLSRSEHSNHAGGWNKPTTPRPFSGCGLGSLPNKTCRIAIFHS